VPTTEMPTGKPVRFSVFLAGAWLAILAGCSGERTMPTSTEADAPAELRTGEVTVRATTLPTARLNPAMARQYAIAPDAGSVLLVIGMRRGLQSQEASVAGRVSASASDLLGNRQAIELREIRNEGFIDYVGTARVSMPDTLRFEIVAKPDGAPAATLRFHRDFFP
jgi:hypothetical protein